MKPIIILFLDNTIGFPKLKIGTEFMSFAFTC